MNQRLESIINRRWEIAKQFYPQVERETISRLVYRLADFFDWVCETPELETEHKITSVPKNQNNRTLKKLNKSKLCQN